MTTSEHVLDVEPLPAPRPRVSKFGTYYPASYKVYRKAIAERLPKVDKLLGELAVGIEFVCKPIGKSKYTTPMGDLDNFAKGVLDTLMDEGWYGDDRQIVDLRLSKRFPEAGEQPHIRFNITALA